MYLKWLAIGEWLSRTLKVIIIAAIRYCRPYTILSFPVKPDTHFPYIRVMCTGL